MEDRDCIYKYVSKKKKGGRFLVQDEKDEMRLRLRCILHVLPYPPLALGPITHGTCVRETADR